MNHGPRSDNTADKLNDGSGESARSRVRIRRRGHCSAARTDGSGRRRVPSERQPQPAQEGGRPGPRQPVGPLVDSGCPSVRRTRTAAASECIQMPWTRGRPIRFDQASRGLRSGPAAVRLVRPPVAVPVDAPVNPVSPPPTLAKPRRPRHPSSSVCTPCSMTAVAFEELLAPGGRISFTDVWHVISADTRPSASSEPALSTSRSIRTSGARTVL